MNGPEGVYGLSSLRKVAAFLVADSQFQMYLLT